MSHIIAKQLPLVSIVMPIKNEADYIVESIKRINEQLYPKTKIEILIVDGGSTDGTLNIVLQLLEQDERIRLYGDKGINCPQAMNIGIKKARGQIVAKIDGHGYLNKEFIQIAVKCLLKDVNLGCVGGQVIPLSRTNIEKSNSYARFSKFGVGAGIYTTRNTVHEIDTVQCGVYRKRDIVRAGMFDSNLQYGEDEEANYRLALLGKKILYHPDMKYYYFIRPSFKGLLKQYFNYGVARAKVIKKHPHFFNFKHVIPSILVIFIILDILMLIFNKAFMPIRATSIVIYTTFLLVASFFLCIKNSFLYIHYIILSLICLHFGYGFGLIKGIFVREKREIHNNMKR